MRRGNESTSTSLCDRALKPALSRRSAALTRMESSSSSSATVGSMSAFHTGLYGNGEEALTETEQPPTEGPQESESAEIKPEEESSTEAKQEGFESSEYISVKEEAELKEPIANENELKPEITPVPPASLFGSNAPVDQVIDFNAVRTDILLIFSLIHAF